MTDFPLLIITIATVWMAAGTLWLTIELIGRKIR